MNRLVASKADPPPMLMQNLIGLLPMPVQFMVSVPVPERPAMIRLGR